MYVSERKGGREKGEREREKREKERERGAGLEILDQGLAKYMYVKVFQMFSQCGSRK